MDAVRIKQRPQVAPGFLQWRTGRATSRADQQGEIGCSCIGSVNRVGLDRAPPHLRPRIA